MKPFFTQNEQAIRKAIKFYSEDRTDERRGLLRNIDREEILDYLHIHHGWSLYDASEGMHFFKMPSIRGEMNEGIIPKLKALGRTLTI